MIIEQIEHMPGGYQFWHSLPANGKKSAQVALRRWTQLLSSAIYPLALRQAMLRSCLNEYGVPDDRGMPLYLWMLKHMYRGNARELHREWSYLNQATQVHDDDRV